MRALTPSVSDPAAFAAKLKAEERFLRALCYRMIACTADAEDIVQDTFARAIAAERTNRDAPLRPWLVCIATNLARDLLRRRRRRGYAGPWLPAPLEEEEAAIWMHEPAASEARYDLLESVSFAFLLAIEALTPKQRAVLVLRDVFDYDVRETAAALGFTEANVKTTHHRARRAMDAYDTSRRPSTPEIAAETRRMLEAFVRSLAEQDVAGIEALLSEGVRALSDGGGEFLAARAPVVGRAKVARFYVNIAAARAAEPVTYEFRKLNGMPFLLGRFEPASPTLAPRIALAVELAADGRIGAVYTILASRKLERLP